MILDASHGLKEAAGVADVELLVSQLASQTHSCLSAHENFISQGPASSGSDLLEVTAIDMHVRLETLDRGLTASHAVLCRISAVVPSSNPPLQP